MTTNYTVELVLHDELDPEGILRGQLVAEFPVAWNKEKETLGQAIWLAFQKDEYQTQSEDELAYIRWEVVAEFWNNGDGAMIVRDDRNHVASVAVSYDDAN